MFHEGQRRAFELLRKHEEAVCLCGRGWGKSYFARKVLAYFAARVREPGWAAWWVAKTGRQARDIAWAPLVSELRPLIRYVNRNEAYFELKSGFRIQFVGSDEDPDRLRGQNLAIVVWDEPFFCQYPFLVEVVLPALRAPVRKLLLIGTVPAASEDVDPRWFEYIERARREGRLYSGTSRENEGYGLPKGWTDERLEQARQAGLLDVARRELLCEVSGVDAVVFMDRIVRYRETRLPPEPQVVWRVVSMDPHPSRPTAVLLSEVTREGVWYILDARYLQHPLRESLARWQKAVSARGQITHYLCDPKMGRQRFNAVSGFGSFGEYLRAQGIPLTYAESDVTLFSERVVYLAERGRLRFFVPDRPVVYGDKTLDWSAEPLIRQLQQYSLIRVRGKYKKRYRQNDDFVDCLRYLVNSGLDLMTRETGSPSVLMDPYTWRLLHPEDAQEKNVGNLPV